MLAMLPNIDRLFEVLLIFRSQLADVGWLLSLRPGYVISGGSLCTAAFLRCGFHGSAGVLVPLRLGLVKSLAAWREQARFHLVIDGKPTLRVVANFRVVHSSRTHGVSVSGGGLRQSRSSTMLPDCV